MVADNKTHEMADMTFVNKCIFYRLVVIVFALGISYFTYLLCLAHCIYVCLIVLMPWPQWISSGISMHGGSVLKISVLLTVTAAR